MGFVNESKDQESKDETIGEENEELDLDKYGSMEITTSWAKPVFEKITKAKVKEAVLMTKKERKEEQTKEGKTMVFYPVYLRCVFDVEGKEVYENYGGGKLFVSDKKEETHFWLGDNSGLGKLKQIIADNKEFKGSIKEIPELLKDQEVGIKTEYVTVAGTEYAKNNIKQFY